MANDGIIGLVELLRMASLTIPVSSTVAFVEAAGLLGTDLRSVYWAGRATLAHSPAEIALYDLVFRNWILGSEIALTDLAPVAGESLVVGDEDNGDSDQPDTSEAESDDTQLLRFSRTETLRAMDFAALSEEERAESDRAIAEMRVVAITRKSQRRQRSNRRGGDLDLRRSIRESLRTGGEPMRLRTRHRSRVPRRVVILADVSGSMTTYSRPLLRFAHAAVNARAKVEAFAVGTRVTRLTRELTTRDPDEAMRRATASVPDWSGGTRLGEGIGRFNDEYGTKGMARGAIVVILSDGWDRGDAKQLASEMERLSRVAYRIVWANPLKASEGYAPLARGMAAALPFIDEFIEGHSLDSLDRLSDIISDSSPRPLRSAGLRTLKEVDR